MAYMRVCALAGVPTARESALCRESLMHFLQSLRTRVLLNASEASCRACLADRSFFAGRTSEA
eukprot:6201928-Pleurochrysis_carterae.AAC.2